MRLAPAEFTINEVLMPQVNMVATADPALTRRLRSSMVALPMLSLKASPLQQLCMATHNAHSREL